MSSGTPIRIRTLERCLDESFPLTCSLCRLAPMTIGAPNITFIDLNLQSFQACCRPYQTPYMTDLLAAHMVKLQHDQIGFAAVHAGVRLEVRHNILKISLFGHRIASLNDLLTIAYPISLIIGTFHTLTTPALKTIFPASLLVEGCGWQPYTASTTEFFRDHLYSVPPVGLEPTSPD